MQSSWHNLPEFGPQGEAYQQQPGAETCASNVEVTPELDGISMDLAPAYSPPAPYPAWGSTAAAYA